MLIAAAAERWSVPVGEIKAENGVLSHASGKSATMAHWHECRERSVSTSVALKERTNEIHRQPGAAAIRSRPKSNGTQQYTIDLREPGMLTAVMIHPPLLRVRR